MDIASEDWRAFLLWANGAIYDLHSLIRAASAWTVQRAHGINHARQSPGYGYNPAGDLHAFLLTPIPEPSTLGLLALAIVVGIRWLRKR